MIKKTITYTDYDGNQRKKEAYFNLSKVEVVEMEMTLPGGMKSYFEKIIAEKDSKRMWDIFTDVIRKSYGEKSIDGDRFIKSPELAEAFMQTEAYSELMIELLTNAEVAADFMNGIISSVKAGSNA